jgi:hypothetical protein
VPPGTETVGGRAPCLVDFGLIDFRRDGRDYCSRYFILNGEDVIQAAIVAFRLEMVAGLRIYQLPRYPDPRAASPDTAFQDVADAQIACNITHIRRFSLIGKRRIARDHEQRAKTGETSYDLLGHAVGEKLLLSVSAHICKGQYGNRRFVGKRWWLVNIYWAAWNAIRIPVPDPYRPGDIFYRLLARVLKGNVHLTRKLVMDIALYADAAWLCQTFQSCSNVDAISQDVIVINNDVAEIDPDAVLDTPFIRNASLNA